MSNPLMEKMLDLPEFEVTDFKQNDNDMGFYVETKKRPTFCPVCGCYMPNLVIYKSRKQTVRDISVLGKRTALIINRHYYECRECGGRFAEPLESVGDNERITKRLRTTLSASCSRTYSAMNSISISIFPPLAFCVYVDFRE